MSTHMLQPAQGRRQYAPVQSSCWGSFWWQSRDRICAGAWKPPRHSGPRPCTTTAAPAGSPVKSKGYEGEGAAYAEDNLYIFMSMYMHMYTYTTLHCSGELDSARICEHRHLRKRGLSLLCQCVEYSVCVPLPLQSQDSAGNVLELNKHPTVSPTAHEHHGFLTSIIDRRLPGRSCAALAPLTNTLSSFRCPFRRTPPTADLTSRYTPSRTSLVPPVGAQSTYVLVSACSSSLWHRAYF